MVRSFCSSLARFFAAVILLALLVCAAEVGLRAWRLQQFVSCGVNAGASGLTIPSSRTWVDVQPLLDVRLPDEGGRALRIQTNESGLRAPTVTVPKPRGLYRIVCLGGSTVFGAGVDQSQTLTAQLAQALAGSTLPVEVINAGCPDAGPLVSLLRFRHQIASLQPDLVLLCLAPEELRLDDQVRGVVRLDESRSPAYAPHPAAECRRINVMDSLCREFVTLEWALGKAGDAAGMPRNNADHGTLTADPRRWAAVVPLHQQVAAGLGNLVISVAPGVWSLGDVEAGAQESAQLREFLSQVSLSSVVPVQDSLLQFQQISDPRTLFSPTSGQLSEQGNRLYAQQLAEFLFVTVPGLRNAAGPVVREPLTPQPVNPPAGNVPPPIPNRFPEHVQPLSENPPSHPLWTTR